MRSSIFIQFKFLLLIFWIIFSNLFITAQNTNWQSSGPYGGNINCLTLSASNPDILFAGTKSGIYKTQNGGDSWIKTNFPDYYEVTSIKVHTTNPEILMAGTKRKGAYLSQNGGISWDYMGLWDITISTMETDSNNPDVLYFGTGEFLTGTKIGIYKAEDNWYDGAPLISWEAYNSWYVINKIVVDPDSSSWIYAAGIASGSGSILISKNGGETWEDKKIGTSSTDKASNIAITKNNQEEKTIFAIYGSIYLTPIMKLYKSDDMGDTWQEIVSPYSGDLNPNVLMTHPTNSNSIIIGSYFNEKPLWIYNNETDSWSYINGGGLPNSSSPTSFEISADGNIMYLTTQHGGIYKFKSSENKWKQINIGFNNSFINDLVVIPNFCNTIFASTEEELKLSKSTNAGSSWSLNASNLSTSFDILTLDPNDPSVFYAAKNISLDKYYFYKGTNYGQTWTGPHKFVECVGNKCYTKITDILVKPGDSNSILICSKPYFLSPSGLTGFGVIARTTDGGNNWDKLFESPGTSLAIDPQNPDIVYVGKERPGQLFKVDNAWGNQVTSEITPSEGIEGVQDIIVDNQGNVFVATESGLWRRTGDIWNKLNCIDDNVNTLAIDNSKNLDVIYAGSKGNGVFVSNDNGNTWNVFNEGIGNLDITKLVICNNMIYAGTEYGGIWSRVIPDEISVPFLTHNTGNMKISVFQNGAIGHASPNWNYGDGLEFKNNIDPLFNCGLILGTSERGVVNGQIGSFGIGTDFQCSSPISGFESIPGSWDQVTTAQFNDYSSLFPYGMDITQRSYSNNGEDILMLKYAIKNTTETKNNLYTGLFADWDVGGGDHHTTNLGGFDLSRNLAYQYLENGNPDQNYYGIVALNGMAGTRITGKGSNLYVRDSSFVWISTLNTAEITESGEYRTWIGSGPYNLDTNESLLVYFAIVAGSTLEELKENADLAAQKHQILITNIDEKEMFNYGFNLNQNYPNPFSGQTEINYSIPYNCNVQLDLINIEGMKIKTIVNKNQVAGKYKISFNADNLSSGIYFYRLKAGSFSKTKKMVVK